MNSALILGEKCGKTSCPLEQRYSRTNLGSLFPGSNDHGTPKLTPLLLESGTAVLAAQLLEQLLHIVRLCIVGIELQHSLQLLPGKDRLAVPLVGQP